MLCLVARDAHTVRRLPLPEREARLGASEDNDLTLPFEGVSRRHAVVRWCERGVELVDARSKNGLLVGGRRVPSVVLVPGAHVQIGRAVVSLEEADTGDLLPAFPIERNGSLAMNKTTLPLTGDRERMEGKGLDRVVHRSVQVRTVIAQAIAFARTSRPILILGETGTGKDVIARVIHDNSAHADGPFIAVNCAAIAPGLLASELFGIENGVATNVSARGGYFAVAEGGTLLLDEIAELSESLQAALLRAVEERVIWPVGARRPRRAGARVVFATNRNDLRADLFFRCKRIEIPPLRERREDVEELARYFIESLCHEHRVPAVAISRSAVDLLRAQEWPGNARELRDVLEDAVLLHGRAGMLHAEHFRLSPHRGEASSMRERHDALTRDMIASALQASGGNKSDAARRLGMSRNGVRKAIDRFGLK